MFHPFPPLLPSVGGINRTWTGLLLSAGSGEGASGCFLRPLEEPVLLVPAPPPPPRCPAAWAASSSRADSDLLPQVPSARSPSPRPPLTFEDLSDPIGPLRSQGGLCASRCVARPHLPRALCPGRASPQALGAQVLPWEAGHGGVQRDADLNLRVFVHPQDPPPL